MSESSTRKSASKPVYQSVSRTRTESSMVLSRRRAAFVAMVCRAVRFRRFGFRRFAGHAKKISRPSPGMQQRLARSRINFSPQAVHVHLDQVRKRVEAFVPHVFGNFRATHHAPRVAREKLEQCILLGRDRNVPSRPRDALRTGIEHQVGYGDLPRPEFPGAAQQGAQSREQLAKFKWFCQV